MSAVRAVAFVVRRDLRQYAVSATVAAVTTALAVGLVLSVFGLQAQTHAAFTGGAGGFDAVLGARGSQLQLVLNAVFHLDTSPGNIPWALYDEVARDRRVALAVPYATGDSYEGYRVVGTTDAFFSGVQGGGTGVEAGGRIFDADRAEAVVGRAVADETGLRVGSTFFPSHGVGEYGRAHDEAFVVTGILEPTSSPLDRVIWIPIEGVFRMGGHVLRGGGDEYEAHPHEDIPDSAKEVSAVMLKFRSPMTGFAFDQAINRDGKDATLAFPIGGVMAELFDKLGWAARVLGFIAYLVVFVAAGTIFVSLYSTIHERRREIAILRSLGASRPFVFTVVLVESSTIALVGALLGVLVHAAILIVAADVIRETTGVVLQIWTLHPALVWTPLGMVLLGAGAGLVPAAKAFNTDVADALVPRS